MAVTDAAIATPKIFITAAGTAAQCATAVQTQVNSLILRYTPGINGATPPPAVAGSPANVQPGSIVVNGVTAIITSADAVSYFAVVNWVEFVDPT